MKHPNQIHGRAVVSVTLDEAQCEAVVDGRQKEKAEGIRKLAPIPPSRRRRHRETPETVAAALDAAWMFRGQANRVAMREYALWARLIAAYLGSQCFHPKATCQLELL